MEPFDYISLLTSIVIALGITRILTGIGKMLQLRQSVRPYWVHLVWVVNVLLWLLLNWWILYRWRAYQGWSFFLFLFLLVSPTIAFLLSVLLVPEPLEEKHNLRAYYYANHRWFFTLAALLPVVDAVDTLLKGWEHFVAQGPIYVATLCVLFTLSVIGAWTRNERFHGVYSIFFAAYLFIFIGINLQLLT